jgi:hypothetical protein
LNAQKLLERAEQLEDLARTLVETGLDKLKETFDHVRTARVAALDNELPKAADELNKGDMVLHDVIFARSRWWRMTHIHQFPLFTYYVGAAVVFLVVGRREAAAELPVWNIPLAVYAFGGIGAVLRGIWYLHRQVARRIYRPVFLLAHLSAPLIGCLFGMVSYLLLRASLMTLDLGSTDLSDKGSPLALALLAGFSWEVVFKTMSRWKNDS